MARGPQNLAVNRPVTFNDAAAAVRAARSVEEAEAALEKARSLLDSNAIASPDVILGSMIGFDAHDDDVKAAEEEYQRILEEPIKVERELRELAADTTLSPEERVRRGDDLNTKKALWRHTLTAATIKLLEVMAESYGRQYDVLDAQQKPFQPCALFVEAQAKVAERRLIEHRHVTDCLRGEWQEAQKALKNVTRDLDRLKKATENQQVTIITDLQDEFARHTAAARRLSAASQTTNAQGENLGFIIVGRHGLIPVQLDSNGDPLDPDSEAGQRFLKARGKNNKPVDDNGNRVPTDRRPNPLRFIGGTSSKGN